MVCGVDQQTTVAAKAQKYQNAHNKSPYRTTRHLQCWQREVALYHILTDSI